MGTTGVTVARGARQIPVQAFYPAISTGAGTAPLTGGRPYPLIVFSPGFDIAPAVYYALVEHWASLGYVVAVPQYPFTTAGSPGGVNESDILQHPADLEAVIDRLVALSRRTSGALSGLVDPARIGVAGHSDGGDVTDAVVSDSCCIDPRIRAAAVFSGAELASFGGTYGAPRVPLLVVQGDDDRINAPACSEQIYDTAVAPKFYLDLHGAGHLPPYTGASGGEEYQQAVFRISDLFWQGYLRGVSRAVTALQAAQGPVPAGTLTSGGTVPLAGSCPGAPG